MPTNLVCEATHRQLMSGTCPWCGSAILAGRVAAGSISALPAQRWNSRALEEALDDPNVDVRNTAVTNVGRDGPLDVALPILRRALDDPDKLVSQHATGILSSRGLKLSATEANRLESVITENPNDLAARILLLVYYFTRGCYVESARRAHERHLQWMITHAPHSDIASTAPALLHPSECQSYTNAKELWASQVEAHPENAAILWNAAAFLMGSDTNRCEQVLNRGQLFEPRDPKWSEALGRVYKSRMNEGTDQSRLQAAQMSLAQFENSLTLSDEMARFRLLPVCASAAFECGEFSKAKAYAAEALLKASKPDFDWIAGDSIHEGNVILGRVALRAGDCEAARTHLIRAGKTPGSPHLKSAGPNMILAKELLEQGERQIVIEFLKLCAHFWFSFDHQPDQWIHILEQGGVPTFEAYLR